jgi:hypothetical protein
MAQLYESAVGTTNSAGAVTIKLGPLSRRETWTLGEVYVSANKNAGAEAQCLIYVGRDISVPNFRDGSVNGSTGDKTKKVQGDKLATGEYVWAVWTGGDPFIQVRLEVRGTKEI